MIVNEGRCVVLIGVSVGTEKDLENPQDNCVRTENRTLHFPSFTISINLCTAAFGKSIEEVTERLAGWRWLDGWLVASLNAGNDWLGT
jgi:hypothetical protein